MGALVIPLNARRIAEITGGRLLGIAPDAEGPVIDHVATDSREVRQGTLFVAKPGEVTDGHRFVGTAFAAGATLALVEREVPDDAGRPRPSVLVPDAVEAMGALAAWVVAQLRHDLKVVAVTGSVGKTTTKDLLRAIFSELGPTVAPQGSYNGEVGVPLTVFECTEQTRWLVVEMGATHVGNIAYLCRMVQPDVGAVLCVGSAHAGEFGGVENIAIAKGEMVEGLSPDGAAVLNDDDERVRAMRSRTQAPVVSFGLGARNADPESTAARVWADGLSTDADGHPSLTLHFPDGTAHPIVSGLIGEHHVSNILAAASAAYTAGVEPAAIAGVLDGLGPGSRWRMERTERPDGVTILNDAYNANPQSMKGALQTLAHMGGPQDSPQHRRTWAVLGEMYELGDSTVEEHNRLGSLVVRLNISKLLAVGPLARPTYVTAQLEGSWGEEATWVPDLEAAQQHLEEALEPGDIVLFKSSNSAGLKTLGDRVAGLLPAQSPQSPSPAAPASAHDIEGGRA